MLRKQVAVLRTTRSREVGNGVVSEALIRRITERLVREFDPVRVFLFGSLAWGIPDSDSDIDIMVVVRESTESRTARAARAHRILTGIPKSCDILVRTVEEFDRYSEVPASLQHQILHEGILLYG